jgi:hypothetical protein
MAKKSCPSERADCTTKPRVRTVAKCASDLDIKASHRAVTDLRTPCSDPDYRGAQGRVGRAAIESNVFTTPTLSTSCPSIYRAKVSEVGVHPG